MISKYLFSSENISLKSALNKINKNGKKCLIITTNKKVLLGVLTDGDVRHAINKNLDLNQKIKHIYNNSPIYIDYDLNDHEEILKIFDKHKVFMVPVIDRDKKIKDVYFLDDFLSKKHSKTKKIKADVFIMAGGEGKRLRPITEILPKPLFPVNGQPIIDKIINDFNTYKVRRFYISVNYKSNILKAFLSDTKQRNKISFINEKIPLGTAGSLTKAPKTISNNFILTNADILIDIDFYKIFKFHLKFKADLTIIAVKKNIVIPYGECLFDESNNLIDIKEKPSFNFFVNSGIYICNKRIIKFIPKNLFYNMDTLIKKLIKNKLKVKVYNIENSNWIDIGEWSKYNSLVNNSNNETF